MVMMLAGASLLPRGSASEVCEKGETTASSGSCLLHMVKEFGLGPVQRFIAGSECLKRPAAAASSPMKSKPIPYVRFGGVKKNFHKDSPVRFALGPGGTASNDSAIRTRNGNM